MITNEENEMQMISKRKIALVRLQAQENKQPMSDRVITRQLYTKIQQDKKLNDKIMFCQKTGIKTDRILDMTELRKR